ncbi:MAG: TIM barrel protein [Deltaproteobacteria bacterium]|nr:TIM barrel protein [Deltaproteobacteria bacterium]
MSNHRRIRIGNQSAFSAERVIQPFEFAVASGFDAFEWLPDKKESGAGWQECDIDAQTRRYIRNTARQHDIRLSVHAPWHVNPSEPDLSEQLLKTVQFAQDIEASLLNVHLFTENGTEAYVRGIIPFIKSLRKTGSRLSIENTPLTAPGDLNAFFATLQHLAPAEATQTGMCLDLGHANLCSATLNDYIKFIDLLDPDIPIIHIHLHENYGDHDSHLTLFTGPSGQDVSGIKAFLKLIKKRRFSGSIILEQWPEPPSLLIEARNNLKIMIGNSPPPLVEPRNANTEDFVSVIAEADRQHRSWREKLAWVHDFVAEKISSHNTRQLTYLMIYLRFIGTGQVACTEDGKHYRPSHHAKIARGIHNRLAEITTPENVFIIRKIYPWLPSYENRFANAEPLTRIRDLAHRNDICKELKQEIKHTLQNKLHRCAGPEDLATSAALLKRITAPNANYPNDFVKEFVRFHEELEEFFNVHSLEEQLEAIASNARKDEDSTTFKLISDFLKAKKKAVTSEELITAFELLTTLRRQFFKKSKIDTSAQQQGLQLADIRLEDYAFVLLSQLINHLATAGKENMQWPMAGHCLGLAILNLRLSGLDSFECRAIESELELWHESFTPKNREHVLRLKATIDRCRRLAERYSDKILSLFPEKVQRLGRALGVAKEAIRVFSEAEIRSHLVFQVSRLVDLVLKSIRSVAYLSPWDAIVCEKVCGRLVETQYLDDLSDLSDELVVVLLEKARGDEELSAGVGGIVLAHEMAHLSHLAVRARQEKVALAVCEDANQFGELRNLVNTQVVLGVSPEGVVLATSSNHGIVEATDRKSKIGHGNIDVADVPLSFSVPLIPLNEVTQKTGGSKAYGARRLEEISRVQTAGFATPPGVVIPFGVMEESLHFSPALKEEYQALVNQLNDLEQDDFSEALARLQRIHDEPSVSREIVRLVQKKFPHDARLMVRSSANCEDLERLSGAGLYESVANVSPSELSQAICEVWRSLWAKRAVMNRKRHGIPHDRAHMALLIQQMLVADLSFIIHTVNPIDHNTNEAYVELAVGLGETLASGKSPGCPYRMLCDKNTGAVRMLAFASFSQALWPDLSVDLRAETIDYSKINLTIDEDFRNRLGGRLGAMSRFVEKALGGPQDIEGLVIDSKIYLVQARPQQDVL